MEELVKIAKSPSPKLIVLNSSKEKNNGSPMNTLCKKVPHSHNEVFKENDGSPFKVPISPLKALKSPLKRGRRSLTPLDLNTSDLVPRESLGILPSDLLARESLGGFHASPWDAFEVANISARESLGILNLSAFDLEPVNIFDVKNAVLQKSPLDESKKNLNVDALETARVFKIPKLAFDLDEKSDLFPLETGDSSPYCLSDLNVGFLYPNSRKQSVLSGSSSGRSTNPSFNSCLLEEISFIPPLAKSQNDPSSDTDIFNQAFEDSEDVTKLTSTTFAYQANKGIFSTSLENVRNRIQSLPVMFEEKVFPELVKQDAEQNDDSVFLNPHKLDDDAVDIFEEHSSSGKHFLDATPQPNWSDLPEDSTNSESEVRGKCDKETISKVVDKMLGMRPPQVEEKLKIKSSTSDAPPSSETSANVSRISKNSRGDNSLANENNLSQNQSRATQTSLDESPMKMLADLSNIIHENERLSTSQKQEGKQMIDALSDMLCRSQNMTCSSEDSGRSSVDEHHLDQTKNKEDGRVGAERQRRLLCAGDDRSSRSCAVRSAGSETRISHEGTSAKTPPVNGLKKSKTSIGGSVRKGPLRAIIPVEDMAKINSAPNVGRPTTPKKDSGLRSKRTSTPIHEPRLRPVAASTPTNQPKFSKDSTVSPLARTKLSKPNARESQSSDVARPKTSSLGLPRSVASRSASKVDAKLIRRNSTSEEVRKNTFSPDLPKGGATLKRSYSLGKESKIQSALSKVRQNILNSPYYTPRQAPGAGQANGLACDKKFSARVPARRNSNKENVEAL